MSTAEFIRQLIAAGLSVDDALTAGAVYEAREERKVRSAGAVRQERYRRNKASHVTQSDAGDADGDVCDVCDALSSPEGFPPTPPFPKPLQSIPPSPPKGGSSPTAKQTARSVLAEVLDPRHVEAVLDHRRAIRRPLTVHAAGLLARKLALMPDPNAAADAMIGAGWQGFEPEWLENRNRPANQRSPPAQARQSAFQQRQDQAKTLFANLANGGRSEQADFHDSRSAGPDLELGRDDYRFERQPFPPDRQR